MSRRNWGLTDMRHSEQPEINKHFAWLPFKSTSGKLLWFTYYYHEIIYTNVEPKHRWRNEKIYTEWEYFVKKLTD